MTTETIVSETNNGTTEAQVTAEQAQQAILADKQRRERMALQEINATLQRLNCRMQPVFAAEGTQVTHTIKVIAN